MLLLVIFIFTQEVSRKEERTFSKALAWASNRPKSCLQIAEIP